MARPRRSHIATDCFLHILLLMVVVAFAFPIVWTVLTSLKTPLQTFAIPPVWIFRPTLVNYRSVFEQQPFARYLLNSIIIALGSTGLALGVGVPASYAFSALKFRGRETFLIATIGLRMLPPIALVVPLYSIVRSLGLLDTHLALVLIYAMFNAPFVIWMLKGFFDEIPEDVRHSALVDGCSHVRVLWRIVVPLAAPGLFATAVFTFILSWNDFIFALFFTTTKATTLPVAVSGFITEEGVRWGNVGSGGAIILLPVIAFTLLVQKYLVRGMTAGAVKG